MISIFFGEGFGSKVSRPMQTKYARDRRGLVQGARGLGEFGKVRWPQTRSKEGGRVARAGGSAASLTFEHRKRIRKGRLTTPHETKNRAALGEERL